MANPITKMTSDNHFKNRKAEYDGGVLNLEEGEQI